MVVGSHGIHILVLNISSLRCNPPYKLGRISIPIIVQPLERSNGYRGMIPLMRLSMFQMRWEEVVSGPGLGEDGSWVGCPVGLPSDRINWVMLFHLVINGG